MGLIVENFPNIKNDIYNALTYFALGNDVNNDLLVMTCGHEQCSVDKPPEGPHALRYFVLHYVVKGCGTFVCNNKKYNITKDHSFIIYPNTEISYQQDKEDPWEYYWVSFLGLNAEAYVERCTFSHDNPVLNLKSENVSTAFKKLSALNNFQSSKDIKALAIIFEIFSAVIEEVCPSSEFQPHTTKSYVAKAVSYIEINYSKEDLTLNEVSSALNINPNYLSRLFTKTLKIPFSVYLTLIRLQEASKLIKNTDMYFKNIAASVGYSDSLYFSRIFKKYMGLTPKEYKISVQKQ